jgi:hypothetical protein
MVGATAAGTIGGIIGERIGHAQPGLISLGQFDDDKHPLL